MKIPPIEKKDFSFETVTVDERGGIIAVRPGHTRLLRLELPGGTPLELALIPGGRFQMGSSPGQGYPDEVPQHWVSLAPFWLGVSPVTQAQWRAISRQALPWRFNGAVLPVENVAWRDTQDFCHRLSHRTRLPFALPSEAQWEYACRAGTQTPFAFGPTLTTGLANYVGEHTFRAEPAGIYRHTPTPAGTFPPNAFGLYDLHGNLWEWCADGWHNDYQGAPTTGEPWMLAGEPGYRVARGGSWHEIPGNCRSAVRLRQAETTRDDTIGFRIALNRDPAPPAGG